VRNVPQWRWQSSKKTHLRQFTATEVTVCSVSLSVAITFLGAADLAPQHHNTTPLLLSSLLSRLATRLPTCHISVARDRTPYIRVFLARHLRYHLQQFRGRKPRSCIFCLILFSVRFLFLASTNFAPEDGSTRGTATGSESQSR
jgi:hypothetical protein